MKIKREELISALTKVKPGLANNEIIEQSTHFCFDEGSVRTFNDWIAISYKFDFGFNGVVSAKEFFALLQKLKDEEIEIEQNTDELLIKGKKKKASFFILTDVSLPSPEIESEPKFKSLPKNFCEAIKFASFSAGKDASKPHLTCLYINDKEVISTDDFRITQVILDKKINDEFLLPASSATELTKYRPTQYSLSKGWIHFSDEAGTLFSSRTVEIPKVKEDKNQFPHSVYKFFEVEGERISLPSSITEIIDRVQVLADAEFEQDRKVDLILSDGKLTCETHGTIGSMEEYCRIRYKGDDIKLTVHPVFLIEILNHLKEMVVGKRSLLFKGDNFKHVMALVSK